jgi:hypothetical protein
MKRKGCFHFLAILGLAAAFTGCGHKNSSKQTGSPDTFEKSTTTETPQPPAQDGYFKTPFQSESQFIVEAIVSDLAEEMYYAAKGELPDKQYFSVVALERPGSSIDTPSYDLQISLDNQNKGLKLPLPVNGPIWSPDVYANLAKALAKSVGLHGGDSSIKGDPLLLSDLTDWTAEAIEKQDLTLSGSLEKNFSAPRLHEQAALLLGAFAMREHSGPFHEIRSPLSRITAHLTMAHHLNGPKPLGVEGQLAEAFLLTLESDAALALEKLKTIDTNDTDVAALIRALRAWNTGDFRELSKAKERTQAESVACYYAIGGYASGPAAWSKLTEEQKLTIDYLRIASELERSVEIGHGLLEGTLPLEMRELTNIYQLSRGKKLAPNSLVEELNVMPERCFTAGTGSEVHVRVIGWGQWAMFFQRHLCHAVQQDFWFMNYQWGVKDEAVKFAAQCDKEFDGLRLYPFVRRYNSTEADSYHKSEDDAFKVTVETPQLVPAECWDKICYKPSFAEWYLPNANPHLNEWHSHNPPPGTVYDLGPRLEHPSLTSRSDVLDRFEKLHEMNPYDLRISYYLLKNKYGGKPTYEQAMELMKPVLPWSANALRTVAGTVYDKPEECEKLMLQAADLDPVCYYDLHDYLIRLNQEEKAVHYMEKACESDPDGVRVAGHAEERVRYYLKNGKTDKAREIADFAGEVYSSAGLTAKAVFMEETSNYDGAFKWFAKIEERYDDSKPLIYFCFRYGALTGDTTYNSELRKREQVVFPKGSEKVFLPNPHEPPSDGVIIKEQNDTVLSFGLKQGDIIVSLDGIRVHDGMQYSYVRELQESSSLDLMVWQGDAYHEVKASPPKKRFGVLFDDYRKK